MSSAVSVRSSSRALRHAERRGVVVLAGDWQHTGVAEELGAHYELVRLHDEDKPPTRPVDWLLVSPGTSPRAAERLATRLRDMSPALRVAIVVRAGNRHETRSCDVRVPDSARPADLVAAMRLAHAGIAVAGRSSRATRSPTGEPDRRFTDRETELLRLLCAGLSNEQIARRMRISRRTVEFHLTRIFRKLGVNSRVEAALQVQRNDVLS